MKKYLLPLILILLLAFTLAGFGADLFGTYDQRIKLTIDNTKIDATLTWFPVTVLLTATAGEEVFVEFDADTDFDKVAFTKADGTTQLCADCELFDDSEQKAIYHVSLDGWEIASGADTDFYMYYDNDAGSNSSYIGLSGGGSQYPSAQSDTYVKSTTKASTSYWAYYATDPTKSLTGSDVAASWISSNGSVTNQRFHIDLGSAIIIKRIYYENFHASGAEGSLDYGVQNFTFWGSNTGAGSFDDLVYANDGGWTQLTISQSTFDEHIASDEADPKYITVTNSTAYRYYAFKFADNHGDASYMGVRRIVLQTSVAAQSVWDGNFKAVYHMTDATTSTIKDSTSNNNDGTKKAANEPVEENGSEQHFDGSDDYITTPTLLDVVPTNGTFSIYLAPDDTSEAEAKYLFYKKNNDDNRFRCYWLAAAEAGSRFVGFEKYNATVSKTVTSTTSLTNTYYLITGTWGSSGMVLYVNGVSEDTDPDTNAIVNGTDYDFTIGSAYTLGTYVWDGVYRELRVSSSQRNAAWTKAEYNSLFDTLLTYGSEETPTGITWNGITITKWNGITITKINGK